MVDKDTFNWLMKKHLDPNRGATQQYRDIGIDFLKDQNQPIGWRSRVAIRLMYADGFIDEKLYGSMRDTRDVKDHFGGLETVVRQYLNDVGEELTEKKMRKRRKSEYNIIKNMRDRFYYYKQQGVSSEQIPALVADELRVPESQVRKELAKYGYLPAVGDSADIPQWERSHGQHSGVLMVSESVRVPGTQILLEKGDRIRVKPSKSKKKVKKESVIFDDGEEAIEDLAEAVESAGIEWYGIDSDLATSMGEYVVYFPTINQLVFGYEYEYLLRVGASFSDIEDIIADALDERGNELASFMGTTVDQLQREFAQARSVDDMLPLVLTIQMYSGDFGVHVQPIEATIEAPSLGRALGVY